MGAAPGRNSDADVSRAVFLVEVRMDQRCYTGPGAFDVSVCFHKGELEPKSQPKSRHDQRCAGLLVPGENGATWPFQLKAKAESGKLL